MWQSLCFCTYGINEWVTFKSDVLSFILQTVLLTFILLLFGEIMPKIYTRNVLQLCAERCSDPGLPRTDLPSLAHVLVSSTSIINKGDATQDRSFAGWIEKGPDLTQKEIPEEKQMLEEIIKFLQQDGGWDHDAAPDMVAVGDSYQPAPFSTSSSKTAIPAFPFYDETEDQIKGILYIKDCMSLYWQTPDIVPFGKAWSVPPISFLKRRRSILKSSDQQDPHGHCRGWIRRHFLASLPCGRYSGRDRCRSLTNTTTTNNCSSVWLTAAWFFEGRSLLTDFYRAISQSDGVRVYGKRWITLVGLRLRSADFLASRRSDWIQQLPFSDSGRSTNVVSLKVMFLQPDSAGRAFGRQTMKLSNSWKGKDNRWNAGFLSPPVAVIALSFFL